MLVRYVLYSAILEPLAWSSVLVHRPYASLDVVWTREGRVLARRVITPPVWRDDCLWVTSLHDEVTVLVGDGR